MIHNTNYMDPAYDDDMPPDESILLVTLDNQSDLIDKFIEVGIQTINMLDNITTEQFSRGADKPIRDKLRLVLRQAGVPLPED